MMVMFSVFEIPFLLEPFLVFRWIFYGVQGFRKPLGKNFTENRHGDLSRAIQLGSSIARSLIKSFLRCR